MVIEANLKLFNEQAKADSQEIDKAAAFAKTHLRVRFEQLLVFGASIFQEILTAIREEETLESKLEVGKHLMAEWLKARKSVMYLFETLAKLGYPTDPFFRKSYIEHCQEAMYYLHAPEALTPR